MKQICLLSDTHGFLDERFLKHLKKCDEIWHAGDFLVTNAIIYNINFIVSIFLIISSIHIFII
jgi:predicted phosphodiesterase